MSLRAALLRDDAAGAVLFPRLWTFPE
jgi:hypothetical protein